MITKQKTPTYFFELRQLSRSRFVAGVDEVGVAPLAGPVVAAAVILDPKKVGRLRTKNKWWFGVRDSKMLNHLRREELAKIIYANAISVGVGSCSVEEIDLLNIFQARLIAMKRAVESLKTLPDFVFIDGNASLPQLSVSQKCVVAGDQKILSVACASIVAKVTRDNILKNMHQRFPEYGFDKHKGYPTKLHQQKLKQFGPCEVHRKTFAPVRESLSR